MIRCLLQRGRIVGVVLWVHVLILTGLAQSGAPSVLSARGDLNGDGRSDLVWRNAVTGDVAVSITGDVGSISRSILVHGLDPSWQIAGVGDLDGDGKADLIWRNNQNGDVAVWLLDGAAVRSYATVASVPDLNWRIAAVGDMDGDGRADLVWRNVGTGEVSEWLMDGKRIKSWSTLATGLDATTWQLAGAGDVDGDGRADLIWHNLRSGDVVVWLIDGPTLKSSTTLSLPDTSWQIAGIGDLDGDRNADLIWRNAQSGDVVAWLMNGAAIKSWSTLAAGLDASWQISGIGDRDGDGKADLVWRNSKTGEMSCWLMSGAALKGWTPIVPDSSWNLTVVEGPLQLSRYSVVLAEHELPDYPWTYYPVGLLTETTGKSGITITSMGLGIVGFPMFPAQTHLPIPAGGSIELNPLPLNPDFSTSISTSIYSPTLTLYLGFVDGTGRSDSITVTAAVHGQGPLPIDNSWQIQ
jgi:hypothetical protein